MDTEELLPFFVFKVCFYEHENTALYMFKTNLVENEDLVAPGFLEHLCTPAIKH